jgi:hypothetical protein
MYTNLPGYFKNLDISKIKRKICPAMKTFTVIPK